MLAVQPDISGTLDDVKEKKENIAIGSSDTKLSSAIRILQRDPVKRGSPAVARKLR